MKIKGLIVSGVLFLFVVSYVSAAISFTNGYWSTSFNEGCDAEWTWSSTNYHPPCYPEYDRGGDNECNGQGEQITSAANNPSGGGGRGQRHWEGDGSNANSGGLATSLSGLTEIWIRFYMRYQSGFAWSGNSVHYDKIIYINPAGTGQYIIPEFHDNVLAITTNVAIASSTTWQDVMGGNTADGQWHCYEFHMNTNDGTAQAWLDGNPIIDTTSTSLIGRTMNRIGIGSNQDDPNNGGCYYVDFDDIAIALPSYTGFVTDSNGNPMIGPISANCDDGVCDSGETCLQDSCCDGASYDTGTQVCCSGTVYTGTCCSTSDCSGTDTCENHICTAQAGIPAISSVSGDISNGQTVTISGSGFGSKTQAGPLISSYDDANTADNFYSMGVGSAPGGSWRSYGSVSIQTSDKRSSNYQNEKYVRTDFNDGNYHFLRAYTSGSSFYVSFWWRTTQSISQPSGGNAKFVLLWPQGTGGSASHIQEAFWGSPVNVIRSAQDNGGSPYDDWTNMIPSSPFTTWHHMEIMADASSWWSTQDYEHTRTWGGFNLGSFSSPEWRFGHGTGGGSGGYIEIDQVYIDDTKAHVFISDKSSMGSWSTYSGKAHTEIQVPSAWSGSSISFTLNQGSFFDGETVYLYVVDENGEINADGYPITLGAGTGPVCGDGDCESGETPADCPADCGGTGSCISGADSDGDSVVSNEELISYISEWESGTVTIGDLIAAIAEWKNGC